MSAAPRIDYDGRSLVQGHGRHRPVRIILHDTESHDAKGIRDLSGIALFWSRISWGPGAHVGNDSEGYSARYVDDEEIAYHVQNRNTGSLGIEQVGFAKWSLRRWLGRKAQLEETSQWLAHWSAKHDIPLKLDVQHGVSTHQMQSKRFGGSHWDPGFGYPLAKVIGEAREMRDGGRQAPPKPRRQPDLYWVWLAWKLGEGAFKGAGPSNRSVRPAFLPAKVPDQWWERAEKFLTNRMRAERRRRDG